MDKNSYRIALAIKLDGTATGCLNVGYGQQLHDLLKEASRALLDSNDGPNGEAQDAARYRWLRNKSAGQFDKPIVVEQRHLELGMKYIGPLWDKALDTAIDDALTATKGEA